MQSKVDNYNGIVRADRTGYFILFRENEAGARDLRRCEWQYRNGIKVFGERGPAFMLTSMTIPGNYY